MSGNALENVRPGDGRDAAAGTGELDLFVAVLLGHVAEPRHPEVAGVAARARAAAMSAVRAGREPAGSEPLTALRLAYAEAKTAAAAIRPAKVVAAEGTRWERALWSLAALRHRQRAALCLFYVLGHSTEDVASVLRIREPEARKVVESGVARAVEALGQPIDVRRALRIAGSRLVAAQVAPPSVAPPASRMPRGVVRTLLAPVPDIVEEHAADEAPNQREPRVVAIRPDAGPVRIGPPSPLITDEVLERLEAEGSVIVPPPPPAPSREIVAVPRRRRGPERRHVGFAAAVVAVMVAALLPAGARDVAEPMPPIQPPVVVEQTVAGTQPSESLVAPATPVVRVRRGDSLWRLAERHLDDPLRWRQIWRLNEGRVMPSGERFTNPSLIKPGWRLRLP